jgi:hypothetical protein
MDDLVRCAEFNGVEPQSVHPSFYQGCTCSVVGGSTPARCIASSVRSASFW